MAEMSRELETVQAFVSGAITPDAFAEALRSNTWFEKLLDDGPELPDRSYIRDAGCANTYCYLLKRDLSRLDGALNAQGALVEFLKRRGIAFTATDEYSRRFNLLLSAQPAWLDVDSAYLEARFLSQAPEGLSKTALTKWLRERLRESFRYAVRPPRWLQSPQWPIVEGEPLVFLGQFGLKDYFHDEAMVYVFHDPRSGQCRTLIQVL